MPDGGSRFNSSKVQRKMNLKGELARFDRPSLAIHFSAVPDAKDSYAFTWPDAKDSYAFTCIIDFIEDSIIPNPNSPLTNAAARSKRSSRSTATLRSKRLPDSRRNSAQCLDEGFNTRNDTIKEIGGERF